MSIYSKVSDYTDKAIYNNLHSASARVTKAIIYGPGTLWGKTAVGKAALINAGVGAGIGGVTDSDNRLQGVFGGAAIGAVGGLAYRGGLSVGIKALGAKRSLAAFDNVRAASRKVGALANRTNDYVSNMINSPSMRRAGAWTSNYATNAYRGTMSKLRSTKVGGTVMGFAGPAYTPGNVGPAARRRFKATSAANRARQAI